MKNLVSLNPEQMKVFFLATLPKVNDINVIIKDLGKLLKVLMLWLMKHAKIQNKIKTEDYDNGEDEDHFPTSNHIDSEEETNEAPEEELTIEEKKPSMYVQKNHPEAQILGEKGPGVQTRRTIVKASSYLALLSSSEPQNVNEACRDECWVKAMNEELEKIEKNNTWELVPRPRDRNMIGTKWILKNKLNKNGEVIRNKARLFCKGYAQQEGKDFEETFEPIARIEAIRMFLSLSSFRKFKVYQMDVKSSFLHGDLVEEVYIEQPEGFILGNDAKLVCEIKNPLYGLKQVPRAWYYRLDKYLHQ